MTYDPDDDRDFEALADQRTWDVDGTAADTACDWWVSHL